MAISPQTCPACGAPGVTRICTFCGTLMASLVDTQDEKEALNDFHHLLAGQTEKEKQVEFLQHGFIPEDLKNLIDAGVRSVALVDFNAHEDEPSNAAANRLRAITLKLKVIEPTADAARAIQEFERVLHKHERIEHHDSIAGWIVVAFIALILLGGCIFSIVLVLGW